MIESAARKLCAACFASRRLPRPRKSFANAVLDTRDRSRVARPDEPLEQLGMDPAIRSSVRAAPSITNERARAATLEETPPARSSLRRRPPARSTADSMGPTWMNRGTKSTNTPREGRDAEAGINPSQKGQRLPPRAPGRMRARHHLNEEQVLRRRLHKERRRACPPDSRSSPSQTCRKLPESGPPRSPPSTAEAGP